MVDNGSSDDSVALLRELAPDASVIELGRNIGFAHAANRGIAATSCEAVALLNTDIVLEAGWLERMMARLERDPGLAAVACKMLQLADPSVVYDAGDFLRRDGVCEQRGRFLPDAGGYDEPGEAFSACAGAAVYRRRALAALGGGFDERLVIYLEDVELGLRLQLGGWRCGYEPAVALHAGEGSAGQLDPPVAYWVERNTLLIVARFFRLRWLPLVLYRQLGWARQAFRDGQLSAHVRGALAAVPMLPSMWRERRAIRLAAREPIEKVIPAVPIRGARR